MKRKRLLAWLLTLAMCFSEIGSTGLKVMAAGEDEVNMEADVDDDIQPDDGAGFVKTAENTMFGTQEMAEARNIMQDGTVWRGSYAYFGEYQGEPVKYRVLSNKTDLYVFKSNYSVLLDCDNLLYTDDWADVKEANETMKSKLHFETLENNAIASSYRSSYSVDPLRDKGDKFFYLHERDFEERNFGYNVKGSRIKKFRDGKSGAYWLRYPSEGLVTESGEITDFDIYNKTVAVSPALDVYLSKILFSSAVKGDKAEVGTEYKFTIRFMGLPIKRTEGKAVKIRGDVVSIPYTIYGDNSFYANAVSVLITSKRCELYGDLYDNTGKILLYDRLDIPGGFARNKSGTFRLPEGLSVDGWGSDYFVYIFPEVINDSHRTDYAGEFEEISKDSIEIVKTYTVNFDTNDKAAAPDAQLIEKGEKAVKPSDPKAAGYSFAGWYANQACTGDAFDFDTPITADTTLYAKWIESTWTVSFDPNCEDAAGMPQQQKVMKGNTAVEPKDPTREGYDFGGWYRTAACEASSKYDFSKPVTGNITLYAKWKKLYNVSFDANGGSGNMPSVKVADGDYFTLPECTYTHPNAEMECIGWYMDDKFYYVSSKVLISKDTTFKAGWDQMDFKTVTFVDKYGDNSSVRVKNKEKVSRPSDPAHDGYTFIGWYTYQAEDNKANDDYLYDFDSVVTKDLNLYAAWTDDTEYHISVTESSYMPGGKAYADKDYAKIGDEVTITFTPDEGFEVDHISGVPYYESKFGKVQNYWDVSVTGNTYSFIIPDMTMADQEYKNIRIEACFKAAHEHELEKHHEKKPTCTVSGNVAWAECKVCYHKYLWDEETDVINQDISTDWETRIIWPAGHTDVVTVEAKQPNCTISGNLSYAVCNACGTMWWNSNMGEEITMDDVILPVDVNAHEWDPATVSYSWTDDLSTVTASCCCIHNSEHTYMEAAAVTRTVVKEPTCEEDGIASYTSDAFADPIFEVQTKTGVVIEKTGHDYLEPFYEWSADFSAVSAISECSRDASHKISETVAPKVTGMDGYKKYTATFTNERFEEQVRDIAEVTFDMNGVSASDVPNIQKVDLNDPAVIPYTSPSAEGYIFTGWYSDEDCTKVYDFNTPINKNTVIYAGWLNESATVFTVSFNMMGHGAYIAPVKVESGKKLPRPVDPKESGMEFGGWYTEEECKNAYDFGTEVTKGFTLFAKWSEKATPDPVKGGRSALDPLPEILSDTKDIYLVKGQKFDIPDGWTIARDDKASKKIISISKKGKFSAKKTGDAKMIFGDRTVNVHVYKPVIKEKSIKLEALETKTVEIKDYPADKMSVLWYSASPDVATVDEDGKVTAHAKGSAKITAYINGSAYTCTVKVTEKNIVATERTMHVISGGKPKTINVKVPKVKKLDWKSASENIAFVNKNKVTGKAPGETVLSASANGVEYTIRLFSEKIDLSSADSRFAKAKGADKYTLTLKKGDKIRIDTDASLDQAAVFKSTKPMVAFIDEDGNVEARSKGSGKFTTKLNGKTITITVKVEE